MKNTTGKLIARKKLNLTSFVFCMLLMVGMLTGCGEYMADNGRPTVVCTIYPEYDWLINVLGDETENFNIKLLLDGSADIHSYQPTAADIAVIASCDLLIYPGGESCSWIEDALKNSVNNEQRVIKLMDVLGEEALEEKVIEGMQESLFGHGHSHGESSECEDPTHEEDTVQDGEHLGEAGHSEEDTENHVHVGEYDEHVWLSLRNAEKFVTIIKEELQSISPEGKEIFEENANSYISRLNELDEKYEQAVEDSGLCTLMFADRFAFRYLMENYGLDYYAAFSGCSADAQASFETVTFLAEKLKSESLPAVLILESTDEDLAETIIRTSETADVEILVIDSMQSISAEQKENGYTYLGAMESNLEVLKKALNK